jgi:hypothetical protein
MFKMFEHLINQNSVVALPPSSYHDDNDYKTTFNHKSIAVVPPPSDENKTIRDTNYTRDVKPEYEKAMGVCKKWTGTPCETSEQIIPMLYLYSKLAAKRKHSIIPNPIPCEYIDDFKAIESYRHASMNFWFRFRDTDWFYYGVRDLSSIIPKKTDLIAFSTFHWGIYMTNNISAEIKGTEGPEPTTFDFTRRYFIRNKCLDMKDIKKIDDFRDYVSKEFEPMQENAFIDIFQDNEAYMSNKIKNKK